MEGESSFDQSCVNLSDCTFLIYQITLIPFKYQTQLSSFPPFDYTCVDLIPSLRRKQHFFQEQILDYLKAQTEVFKSGKKQVEGTLEEYLAPYMKKLKEIVGEEQVRQVNL